MASLIDLTASDSEEEEGGRVKRQRSWAWTCPLCTLLNTAGASRCAACDALATKTEDVASLPSLPMPSEADGAPEASAPPQTLPGPKKPRGTAASPAGKEADPLLAREAAARASGVMFSVMLTRQRHDSDSASQVHLRKAESHFTRCQQASGAGMAGRALHSVEYIFNPRLVKAFERQKKLYDLAYGEKGHSQILLFHSTPKEATVRSIVKNGFDMSKVGCTTDPGVYGAGMYLSESADSSLAYGGGAHLLLCKVLPGRPALLSGVQGGGAASLFGRRKPVAGFDSHVIDANFSEVVVFTSAALLPCYILNLAAPQSLRRGASLPSAATLGMAGHGVAGLALPPASAMPTARHGGGGAAAYYGEEVEEEEEEPEPQRVAPFNDNPTSCVVLEPRRRPPAPGYVDAASGMRITKFGKGDM